MTERPGDRGPWEADFDDVMKEAAQYGHVGIIKWLHGQGFGSLTDLNVWEALCNDHLAAATSILLEGNLLEDYEKQQLRLAALSGHRTTLQWIYMNFLGLSDAMERAATTGDLAILQWLHKSEGCWEECSVGTMDAAVCGGHLRVVEWLHENCSEGCSEYAVQRAAGNGDLLMLRWLHQHYSDRFTVRVMDTAAAKGRLETVKWLHEHRPEGCTSLAMDRAARSGHLEVLRWLHDNRTEGCTTEAMDRASQRGHLEIVKWLHANTSEGCTDTALYEVPSYWKLFCRTVAVAGRALSWLVQTQLDGSRWLARSLGCCSVP